MPLDATRANSVALSINDEFAAIGSRMPRAAKRNTEALAWEYHCASHLLRLAEARKQRAVRAAVKAAVLFNHEEEPLAVGTNQLVFAGDLVEISVAVTAPGLKLDEEGLAADLVKAGLKRATVDRLLAKHTHEMRAPHKFTSSLVTR